MYWWYVSASYFSAYVKKYIQMLYSLLLPSPSTQLTKCNVTMANEEKQQVFSFSFKMFWPLTAAVSLHMRGRGCLFPNQTTHSMQLACVALEF